jgi:hypothetical protein
MSTFIHVQKNTISGCWEVRENGHRVSNTARKIEAIADAEAIWEDLQHKGVEVIIQFDLRG